MAAKGAFFQRRKPHVLIILASLSALANACPSMCGECPPPGYNNACCNVASGACEILYSQCTASNVSCSAAQPLPPETCPSWARCIDGYCYAVMDRHPYDSSSTAGDCQTDFISLPVGWSLVPSCNSELAFQLSSQNHDESHYAWATDYLVYANHDYSGTYVFGSNHTGDLCFNATHAPGTDSPSVFAPRLQQKGTSYRVDDSSPGPARSGHAWPASPCALFGKKVLMRMGPDVCASPPPPAPPSAASA